MAAFTIREVDGSKLKLELERGFNLTKQRRTAEGASITVEYAGRRIVLRQRRRGTIEAEGDHTRPVRRCRTGATTFAKAIEWAADELFKAVLSAGFGENAETRREVTPVTGVRTLADARVLAYERNVWGQCSLSQQRKYKLQLDILIALHGPDKRIDVPWSQSDVDLHYAARCGTTRRGRRLEQSELKAYGLSSPGIRFPKASGRRSLQPAKPITARNELADIKVLFSYLMKQSVGGARFLDRNPLDGLDLGSAVRGARADYHPDRFRWLLAAADHADPTGQLRLAVVLAFLTAHRINAILSLEMEHIAFSTGEIRALIRKVRRTHESEPMAAESWAPHFKHGAIHWIAENDKEGFDRVIPISGRVRREIERYLPRREKLLGGRSSRWLFPRRTDPDRRLSSDTATMLLRRAEEIARPWIKAAGEDPDEIMPPTPGDAWHPARGWWQARMEELLWQGNRNASYVGGWTCNTGAVQTTVYSELNPQLMQACVDGLSLPEAAKKLGVIEQAKAALDPDEPPLPPSAAKLVA